MRVNKFIPFVCIAALISVYPSCQKEFMLQVEPVVAATGTLFDASGNCMTDSTVGTFYIGVTPAKDTAYELVKVNVTTAGSYHIVSDIQNGLYFSDSGYFSTIGANTIRLKPVGAPVAKGTSFFSLTFDSTTCNFSLLVKDSSGSGLGTPAGNPGAWQFSGKSGDTTRGSNATASVLSSGTIHNISISGTNATGDTSINITLVLPSATIPATGQYSAAGSTATLQVTAGGGTIYSAIAISGVTLTVTTKYTLATKELFGNFAGVVKTSNGQNATLSSGSFDVTIP